MSQSKNQMRAGDRRVRVGVDTGGTFTDFVYERNGELEVFKVPSTPSDPALAIQKGLDRIRQATSSVDVAVVHGTTVGTNALLQRKGAKTALVTTFGFEDVLAIGRQARPELYNLNVVKPPPLVVSELRFGVAERVVASGEVIQSLDDDEIESLLKSLQAASVDSIAICLLFSFLHPEHEERLAQKLSELDVPISLSSRILPEYREYERTSTTTINAYLQPLMGRYLSSLAKGPGGGSTSYGSISSLRVMQSSGGSISAEVAAQEPVRTILSGPAGGIIGALRVARSSGFRDLITFDMGGTSTDVALCVDGGIRTTNEAEVAGLPVAVPVLDIHTVGAGGGSIARVDEGGSLRVGPESAGADPGPACYGKSDLATVTDAHVVLGHFAGAGLLGGEFPLDEQRSIAALKRLAAEMLKASGKRITAVVAAEGVLAVANANMERALRRISVERGHDPRQFALLPFGGAGGLHAVDLARSLGIPTVIAPASPGALSAVGVLVADIIKDQSRTVMLKYDPQSLKKLSQVFEGMERNARADLGQEGFKTSSQKHERSLALRYRGQSFELEIAKTTGDVAGSFHRAHRQRYGYAQEESEIEIVSARVRSYGLVEKLREKKLRPNAPGRVLKPRNFTDAYFGGKKVRAAVYRRPELPSLTRLRAPAIVVEYSATTLIPEGSHTEVDRYGNLIIRV
ncbi:MAG TPA: hydantoinase/oxoprolinase family protein [Pyrinomonadaceae bacterium]|nr:hydantoinase/oxoprolinase family protein [Pyrinomonadaceae bacterium]